MKQTAVEWLMNQLIDKKLVKIDSLSTYDDFPTTLTLLIEQAKEMERHQIINAHHEGFLDAYGVKEKRTAEQYYKNTYENK